jgi:hypothetical protein
MASTILDANVAILLQTFGLLIAIIAISFLFQSQTGIIGVATGTPDRPLPRGAGSPKSKTTRLVDSAYILVACNSHSRTSLFVRGVSCSRGSGLPDGLREPYKRR